MTSLTIKNNSHSKRNKNEEYITNLEKQLQIKDDLLLQNIKLASLGELLQNITHQWRQPLATISAIGCNMDFKQKLGALNEKELNKCLNVISNNVNKLTNTINNFSILFQNSQYKSHFEIYDSFEYVADILQPQFYDGNIELNVAFDKLEIFTYKSELMQVFMHILNNSIDILTCNKAKKNYIFVEISNDDKNVIIELYDNANGISKENLSKIFDISFSTKGKNGSGSGLYMCRKIIEEKLAGKILASNRCYTYNDIVYKGACFHIELPMEVIA